MIMTCPLGPDLVPADHWWCRTGGDNKVTSPEVYQYTLFLRWADFAYLIITAENIINLAYYKDIIFCAAVVAEFSGIFYYSEKGPKNVD